MRFHHLDLNLLVALDAILTEKNVTRAAGRLNVSQSAASGLLARLRNYFEDDLLVQSGRKMRLTPMAHALEIPLKRILLDIQSNIVNVGEFEPATSTRHFKIMASDYAVSVLVGPLLRKVHALAPNMTFDLLPSVKLYQDVLTRSDIDFLIQPDIFMSGHHPRQWLFNDSYCCVVWRDNPLVKDTMDMETYMKLGHLSVNLGEERAPSFDETFIQQISSHRRVEVSTSHFNALPYLLIGTNRVAVMPRRLANLYVQAMPLKLLEVPKKIPELSEYIQWNHVLDVDPAHHWFRRICIAESGAAHHQPEPGPGSISADVDGLS
ncbi:Nodulation protein D 2 [Vibrio aerogenes CECT 7868]|uniref:Nodulation protein D 2 n=1 Tax=Vibrio aerogenes CECT 7868 TaxID=1216006 RepID=A0A1M6CJ18_9VIBR|nr:LysR family transcriptional regulator [Vibrio aerogenes]SHI61022.1 Nodulation protein D 2 [Vibrio aerogenes CECT 7868]